MNNIKLHITYFTIIVGLLLVLGISFSRPKEVIEVIKHEVDTLIVTKYDTIRFTQVVETERKVVDTIFIESNGSDKVPIPISEYRFFKENEYDIIAKGYNVSLPSISIFPKTQYTTITNTIEKEVITKKMALYAGVEFMVNNRDIIPNIGIYLTTKEKWLIGAKIGYYNDNMSIGGVIAYKLTK